MIFCAPRVTPVIWRNQSKPPSPSSVRPTPTATSHQTPIEPAARQFVTLLGLELDVDDMAWRRLCLKLMEASLQAARIRIKRLDGEPVSTRSVMATAPKPMASPSPAAKGATLEDVRLRWVAVGDRRPRTVDEMASLVRRFDGFSGNKPLGALTREDGMAWRDAMRTQGSSPGTIKKNLGLITSLLNFAVDEGLLEANPFTRIKVPQAKDGSVERLEYSPDDLKKIFECPLYTDGFRPKGGGGEAAVWLPLIGAYTGARLEEMAQLRVADLYEDEAGGWVFNLLNLTESQSVKTASSRRLIPVPKVLIQAGLVEYHARVRASGADWMFPDLNEAVNGTRSGNWSKWWGRYAREVIGITDRRKVFHSLRHAFKTACRAAQVPEEIHDALTGHSSGKIGRSYGSQPLSALRKAIDKVKYAKLSTPEIRIQS